MDKYSNQSLKTPGTGNITRLVSPWLRYLGSLTTVLTVYGYCVMQGVADALNIEGGNLWGAPTDVLHYAFLGIVTIVNRLADHLSPNWFDEIFYQWPFWFATIMIMLYTWAAFRIERSPEAYAARNHLLRNNQLTFWMQKKVGNLTLWQWALVIASPMSIIATMLIAWLGLLMTAAAVVIFGGLGLSSGLAHVANHTPANSYCMTAPAPQEKNAHAVRCVRVRWLTNGQIQSETGILIASASTYALLANPGALKGRRVPLTDQTILETVDNLQSL